MTTILAKRFADIRTYEGLSQKEMASILCVEPNTVSAYENGIVKPSYEKVLVVAKHFDLSLDYVFGLIDERISYKHNDFVHLPKSFPLSKVPEVKRYIKLLMIEDETEN